MGLRANAHGGLSGVRRKVKPGVAVCRHCRAILDQEKAAKHGLGLSAGAAHESSIETDGAGKKGQGVTPSVAVASSYPIVGQRQSHRRKKGRPGGLPLMKELRPG